MHEARSAGGRRKVESEGFAPLSWAFGVWSG
jgi:hypothetical protein